MDAYHMYICISRALSAIAYPDLSCSMHTAVRCISRYMHRNVVLVLLQPAAALQRYEYIPGIYTYAVFIFLIHVNTAAAIINIYIYMYHPV